MANATAIENVPNELDKKPELILECQQVGPENVNDNSDQTAPNNDTNTNNSSVNPVFTDPLLNEPPKIANGPQTSLQPGQPKAKRRVTFPTDNTIVSGFMDPPSPWNDIRTCSTEDLIQGYLSSCDKFNMKPIPRLLQQLHVITNFCDRNDTLTLRGERLDAKHCETLEEILRRVQFRTIDLEASHLDEEGAIALFDMIEYYESCLRLNISYNKSIGPRGWHSMSRMIKKTPCLEYLEARNCTISEQVMPMVGRSLRLGSSLKILHLENSISSGRPLMILVAAVKLNDTLKELFLADNKLMPSDGIQLGNLLKFNHRLAVLDVRNNHLQDVGVSHLCDGLAEQTLGMGLTTLVLWNNQVTYQSMQSLSRAIYSSQTIETLNLGHNNITNEGIHRLKDGLLHNISLLRIGLQAAKISCEGAVALAEYIAETRRLLRMDLRENEIKTGGLMAISLALKVCNKVNRVDLDQEPKRESGVRDYAEQQRRLLQDIANYTQRNRDLARKEEEEQEKQYIAQQVRLEQEALARQAAEAKENEEESTTAQETKVASEAGENIAESDIKADQAEPNVEQNDVTAKEEEQKKEEKKDVGKEIMEDVAIAEKDQGEEVNVVDTEQIDFEVDSEEADAESNIEVAQHEQVELPKVESDNSEEQSESKESEIADTIVEKNASEQEQQIKQDEDEKPPQTPPQHPMRLNLNLPLVSRTQELDSPAFVRSEDLVISSPANEQVQIGSLEEKDLFAVATSPPPHDFPPSPMVSENGQPFLQQVPANITDSLSRLEIESPTESVSPSEKQPENSAVFIVPPSDKQPGTSPVLAVNNMDEANHDDSDVSLPGDVE